jgi:RimJ/RimL family protein N-acetyltransferase
MTAPPEPWPEALRMPPTPVLRTPRLTLRPIRAADAPAVQRRFPQWEVVRYLRPHVPWPFPPDGAAVNLVETQAAVARGEKCCWAITLAEDEAELIGRIDLRADDGVSRDQRGFWLDPEFWGRGLMTEAAERVTEYAFLDLGWPHLWLNNAEENLGSHRVKEKQGARIIDRTACRYVAGEGFKITWLLTREAWLARRG